MPQTSKNDIRIAMRERRSQLDPDLRHAWDRTILSALLRTPEWQSARSVLAYCSFESEVDTQQIVAHGLAGGKRIFLPRIVRGEKRFEPVEVRDLLGDLKAGSMKGLLEPRKDLKTLEDWDSLDLVLVPGIAFDRRGYRIGFGAGMYDKFFAIARKPFRLALAYSMQMIETVPAHEHDEPVQAIVTEEGRLDAFQMFTTMSE